MIFTLNKQVDWKKIYFDYLENFQAKCFLWAVTELLKTFRALHSHD